MRNKTPEKPERKHQANAKIFSESTSNYKVSQIKNIAGEAHYISDLTAALNKKRCGGQNKCSRRIFQGLKS